MKNRATMMRVGHFCGFIAGLWLMCLALAPLVSSAEHGYITHIFPFRYIALVFAITATALSSRWWAIVAIVVFAVAMIRPV